MIANIRHQKSAVTRVELLTLARLCILAVSASCFLRDTSVWAQDPLRTDALKLFGIVESTPASKLNQHDVLLGQSLFWDQRLSADGTTACASCHLPEDWGADRHGQSGTIVPPVGYYTAQPYRVRGFVLNDDSPQFEYDYQLTRGTVLRVVVRLEDNAAIEPNTYLALSRVKDEHFSESFCELEKAGLCFITIPECDGKFEFRVSDLSLCVASESGASIEFDPAFDIGNVRGGATRQGDGITRINDNEGRTATLRGCDLADNSDELTIVVALKTAIRSRIAGRVVDAGGNGIEGATVVAMERFQTSTNASGSFEIAFPVHLRKQAISLVCGKDDMGTTSTNSILTTLWSTDL